MAREVIRGDIWMYAFSKPDKKRPVLVISRQSVIPLLRTVMVAPITSAIHGVPSEIRVGIENGLKHESAVNLDHVQTVDRSRLKRFVGHLDDNLMEEVCRALMIATGCPNVSSPVFVARP
ncbi:MAG: type II toxin-antitoxin system PemK/MazF family toxin [Acidobacteria bacterium]|nr:type II toxin-antitoxin system PemK/MazF family toxin [Acidobacteriota bacterium]